MNFPTALEMTLVGVFVCFARKGFFRSVDNLRHARMILCAIQMRPADKSDRYCCRLEGSYRCGNVQTLEYLIDDGIIQLDRSEYPTIPIHYLVDKPVPAAHCSTAALV